MIEVKDVVIRYGDFTAVKGVNFTVKDSEFFTLLGSSGCGKTTTLRAISGFEKVTSGQIFLDGKDIAPLSPEERDIGFVFQNYALFPSMTVFDNIAFGMKIRHKRKDDIRKEVQEIADLIGISEHLNKKISQISGGQQQRVAIARALILKPKLLLMDEPLSNLDAKLRVSMRGEIKRIQKELGIVAIYVTHDQEEAMAISDKIAVFNNGMIEQIGAPQDVYYHPGTEFVARFVGDINHIENGFIRTEKVKVLSAARQEGIPDGFACLKGKVIECEFLGATTKTRVQTEAGLLTSLNFDTNGFTPGDEVLVTFDRADLLQLH